MSAKTDATRQDGSAFERLLLQSGATQPHAGEKTKGSSADEPKHDKSELEGVGHE